MPMRSSSLANNPLAITRELDGRYDVVLQVRDNLDLIEQVAGIDFAAILAELESAQDFTGITVVQGETVAWDAVNKVLTVPKGDKGDKGDTGDTGLTGPQGIQGPKGIKGDTGLKGDTGSQGPKGFDGEDGAHGPKGDTGDDLTITQITYNGNGTFNWLFSDGTTYVTPDLRGPKGDTGSQGIKGDQGISVHHLKGTSTTQLEGDFSVAGETDTYTFYADAAETLPLGWFAVTNGISLESIPTLDTVYTKGEVDTRLDLKQDLLISGDNIKTINNTSIVGPGNIEITIGDITNLQTELDGRVVKNTNITAGTNTKITYDAKGLVTSATSLSATDIPVLDASKITTGTLAVLRGGTGVTTSTGSGNNVLSTSPVLTTPSLGVATGTSFNSITGLSSTTPVVAGTAAIGTSTTTARADHVHPAQTTITGNAGTATTLATARNVTIGNTAKSFNGSADVAWTLTEIGAQPVDADLTAIGALAGTSGLLKKTATDTWTLDTNTYVTSSGITSIATSGAITGGTITSTGTISHSTADGYLHVPVTGTTNNGKVLTAGATAGSFSWVTPASGVTDHTLLTNIGTNTHAQIDTALTRLVNTSGTNTGDQTITLTGDVTGSGTGSFSATLKNTGTAGTYKSVTTDSQGRVISGTNPTTISGFGITDVYTKTEVDTIIGSINSALDTINGQVI